MSADDDVSEEHLELMSLSTFDSGQDSVLTCKTDVDYLQKCVDSLESKDSGVHLSPSSIDICYSDTDITSLDQFKDSNADMSFINVENIFVECNDNMDSDEQFRLLENEISLIQQDYMTSDLNMNPENAILNNITSCDAIDPMFLQQDVFLSDELTLAESEQQETVEMVPKKDGADEPESHEYVNECTECSMTFRYKRHFDRHMEGHKKNDCVHCNAKFARRKHLDVHLFRVHGETSHRYIYACDGCVRSFPKKSLLHRHRSKHHYKEGKVCPECGDITKSDAELEEHKQRHDGEKLYKCSRCPRAFRIKQTYVIHIQNHDNYKCPTCEDTFASKKAVNEHMKVTHNLQKKAKKSEDAGPYFCKDCRQVFVKKSSYLRHLETAIHLSKTNEEAPLKAIFSCPICSKNLTSRQACVQHVRRVHKGEKKFVCDIHGCTFQCAYKNDLARHKQLHVEERNVVCEYCGKTFTSVSILKDHVLYVHNKERHFVCEECGKSFKRNSLLKRHKLSHQQFRPFSCQQCSAAFKRSHHLTRHMESCHSLTMEKKRKVVKLMKTEDGVLVPVPEKLRKIRHKARETKSNADITNSTEEPVVASAKPSVEEKIDQDNKSADPSDENCDNPEGQAVSQVLSLVDINSGQVVTVQVTDRDSCSMNALVDQFEANCNEMFGLTGLQNLELQNGIIHMDNNYCGSEYYSELHMLGNDEPSLLLDSDSNKADSLPTMEHYPSQSLLSYLNA